MNLLSLSAQLNLPVPPYSTTKPRILETLLPPDAAKEGMGDEGLRCMAVAWVPRTDGTCFLVAHAGGSILVYKKPLTAGDPGGRFSLGLGSNKKEQVGGSFSLGLLSNNKELIVL